jgi:hypothetical protein
MKKLMSAFALAGLMTIAFVPHQSKAALGIGLMFVSPPAGISLIIAGLPIMMVGGYARPNQNPDIRKLNKLMLWMGIMLLDEEGTNTIEYKGLDQNTASKIGLTPSELAAFNENTDVYNAIAEQISKELTQEFSGLTLDNQSELEKVAKAAQLKWQSYDGVLDTESFQAITKVRSFLAAQAQ